MKSLLTLISVLLLVVGLIAAADYGMEFLGEQLNSTPTASVEDFEITPLPTTFP